MSTVWAVRYDGVIDSVFLGEEKARAEADTFSEQHRVTITRETLLTPEQAAVIAAAKAQADAGKVHMDCECEQGQCDHFFDYLDAAQRTDKTIDTLRAQESTA